MKKIIILIISFIIIGSIWFISQNNKDDINTEISQNNLPVLGETQDLTLEDYEGNKISLESFRGEPLVINSWAVWCPFCRDELTDFSELQKEFEDQIRVIAIDRKESLTEVKSFTDSINVTDDLIFLLDKEDSFYKSIGGFGMPETIFVDSNGQIRIHKRGPMDLNEMRQKTNQFLQVTENI